jgi:cytochrome c
MRLTIFICLSLASVLPGAAGCSTSNSQIEPPGWKAKVNRGRTLVRAYGCHTCHEIPTVRDVRGSIGPSLDHVATKYYLAGELPNSPENLRRWIQFPHTVNPHTVMPGMNVTDADAADIAIFLETLK